MGLRKWFMAHGFAFSQERKVKPVPRLLQEHSAAHIFSVPPCSVSKGPLQLLGSGRIGIDASVQSLSGETRRAFLLGFYPLAGTGSRTWVSVKPFKFFSEVRPSGMVNQRQDLVSTFLRVTSKCSVPRRAGCQKGTLWLPFLCRSLCKRVCRRPLCQRKGSSLCDPLTSRLYLGFQNKNVTVALVFPSLKI